MGRIRTAVLRTYTQPYRLVELRQVGWSQLMMSGHGQMAVDLGMSWGPMMEMHAGRRGRLLVVVRHQWWSKRKYGQKGLQALSAHTVCLPP